MRVVLISPPKQYLVSPLAQPPLGLLYLAAVLREHNIEVAYCDLAVDPDIPEGDLYGVTASCADYADAGEISVGLRGRKGKTVLGGPHVTATGDVGSFDAAVIGEGERAILDLVNDYPDLKRYYSAPAIKDLDDIPFPARDLLSVQGRDRWLADGETSSLITSRGCPYDCAFCGSNKIWGHGTRFRSAENVLEEVEHIIDTYGIHAFRIHDDQFILNRKRIHSLLEGFEELGIVWRASSRVDSVTPELLTRMAQSGCVEISYGVESGDQRVLDAINKGTTVEQGKDALRWTHEAGIRARALLMCGMPGETLEAPQRTVDFLEETSGWWDTLSLTEFTPLPGTPIWESPLDFGVKILCYDVAQSWYLYGSSGLRPFRNPMAVEGLTMGQLIQNKQRLRDYVLSTSKANTG